jgi:polyribonucleotide nucleotidyltransferase
MLKAIRFGHEANQAARLQEDRAGCGKPKAAITPLGPRPEAELAEIVGDRLAQALTEREKAPREKALDVLKKELIEKLGESFTKNAILSTLRRR